MSIPSEVLAHQRRLHGMVTRAQALAAGMTAAQIKTLTATGAWRAIRRGVYASTTVPESYEQAVLAAVLVAGEPSWTSHRTAARLWGLQAPPPDAIDVTTLRDRRVNQDGVAHHRWHEVPLVDLATVRGVPATSVARTLLDCLPWLPGRSFSRAVEDAQRRSLVTTGEVSRCLDELDRGQRTGRLIVPARHPVSRWDEGRIPGGSARELEVLDILEAAGLPRPVQQYRVVIDGQVRYLDFAFPPPKVGLEFEGFAEHGLIRSTFDDDRRREAELQLAGWLMIHPTSDWTPAEVVSRVERALIARGGIPLG